MYFPVSGVEIAAWIPPLVAFCISFFCSMGGVSGAFLLLPFQISVLHFTSPSVSSTNLVYNIVAIPGGVYRYIKEGRMTWAITNIVIAGTLPGVLAGAIIRLRYFLDPSLFKVFVGLVLLYISFRLAHSIRDEKNKIGKKDITGENVKVIEKSLKRVVFQFAGENYSFSVFGVFWLALIVGLIGGIYGIGGGAIIAPFLVTVFKLPVYTIAGAALMGTFITSFAGILFYQILAFVYTSSGIDIAPDWLLGILFGAGGYFGLYAGARLQKKVPEKYIKTMLCIFMLFVAGKYILQYFVR